MVTLKNSYGRAISLHQVNQSVNIFPLRAGIFFGNAMFRRISQYRLENDFIPALIRGAGGSFVMQIAGAALAYLVSIYLARSLGPANFGVFAYVGSWVGFLGIVGMVGLIQLTIRETAVAHEEKDWSKLRNFLGYASRVSMGTTLGIAIIATAVAWFSLPEQLQFAYFPVFCIALIALPFSVQTSIRQAVLRGCNRVVLGLLPTSLIYPIAMLIILAAMNLLGKGLNPVSAMSAHAVSTILIFVIVLFLLSKGVPHDSGNNQKSTADRRIWTKPIVILAAISLIQMVNHQADILMLGALSSPREVGIYAPARRTADILVLFLVGVDVAVAPRLAALYAQNRTEQLQRVVTFSTALITVFTLPVAVFLLLWGEDVLALFGPGYESGKAALAVLVIAQLVNSICGPNGSLAIHTKNEFPTSFIVGFAAITNITLNVLLIPHYGAFGAAIAAAAGIILWNFGLTIYVYKKTGVVCLPIPRFSIRPNQMSPSKDKILGD